MSLASSIPVLGLKRVCPWPQIFFVFLALCPQLPSANYGLYVGIYCISHATQDTGLNPKKKQKRQQQTVSFVFFLVPVLYVIAVNLINL